MTETANKERWERLGPLVTELLASDSKHRAQRLAELSALDAALAADVEALYSTLSGVVRDAPAEPHTPVREPNTAGMAGRTLGAYTVERELGHGGMGSVWLAHRSDGRFEGQVAIKFLNAGLVSRGGRERFAREGNILARLAHPNIARLIDAGVAEGDAQPYLVIEYVDGVPIKRYCEEHALDVPARVRLFLDVLAAVAHAHTRLILHRDLKPSNILVTAAGEVKLLDFGIAKLLDDASEPGAATELTQQAGRAYTLQYAAPEQLQGDDVTTATDVYALGVLLYSLLGGVHPTASGTVAPLDQMRAVIETEPKRLSDAVLRNDAIGPAAAKLRIARGLRGDLDNIVAKALKKVPADRYATAALLADDLRRYLADEPVAARPDTLRYRLGKYLRRHRFGVASVSFAFIALALGVGIALWEANEALRQRVQAEGLIEFMLGDLRKKLQPVGRLDVLDAVGAKVLAYYAAQDAGRLDADALGRRARALHLIGEIAERRGSLDDAMRVFQRAADSTAELMARDPHNGQRIFDHAQSVYWVGYIARRRGRLDEAEVAFRQYQALAQQLTRIDRENLDWRIETAYAGQALGVVLLERSQPAMSLSVFDGVRDAWLDIVQIRPGANLDLADAWGWIAKAREALGAFEPAITAQQTKAELLRRVPGADKDRDVQQLLANAAHEIGRLELALGNYAPAELSARGAVALYDTLLAIDGGNNDWLTQATVARTSLAESELAQGERAAALADIARAAADVGRLLAVDATRSLWSVMLAGSVLLQRVEAAGRLAPQQQEFERVLANAKVAESGGKRLDTDQTCTTAAVELALGDLLERQAQPALARAHWNLAAERLRGEGSASNWRAITLLAQAQLRLGAIGEARALARRIEASPYRHPAYADLRQRLDATARVAPVHP